VTIALVVPPSPQEPTPGREFLISGPFEGFTAVATLLRRLGHEVRVLDCRRKADPVTEVLAGVDGAALVGLATYCDSFAFLEEACAAIKAAHPRLPVLLGGPLVSSVPEVVLGNTAADYAVLGEAELTLIDVLERLLGGSLREPDKVRGLAWKDGRGVHLNPPRPQIKDLDHLPFLDYSIWPNERAIVEAGQIMISTTRGCPMRCSFCFKTIPQFREKSLSRVQEELAFLRERTGFSYTWLNDLNFNLHQRRAMALCELMKQHGLTYHVFGRVSNVKPELMQALEKSGCVGIWFGIESYEQAILDLNRKQINVAMINSAVNTALAAGLAVRGLFIIGLPGETEAALEHMVAYIRATPFLPLCKYLVPFPGTSIYEHAVAAGRIADPLTFLRFLSKRVVGDHEDDIINLTDLPEEVLRRTFHEIWELTRQREQLPQYRR